MANEKNVHALKCELKKQLDSIGGITKDKQANFGDKYKFRGIDSLYNVMCLRAAELGLDLDPIVVGEPRIEFQTNAKGNIQTHMFIVMDIKWTSAHDLSTTTTRTIGEAIDTGDKCAGKAISYAMKNGCFAALQIPTHGEEMDVEAYNHQNGQPANTTSPPMSKQAPAAQAQQPQQEASPAVETTKKPRKEKAPPPDPIPQIPAEGNAPADPRVLLKPISECNTFPLLHAIAQDADKATEPSRSELLKAIEARAVHLFELAKSGKEVQEGFPLVNAMGQPDTLKRAANAAYMKFRQGAQQ